MEVQEHQIEDLREAFLARLEEKGDDVAHPKDLARVKQNNDWLARFLKQNELKHTESLEMLWTSVLWRKEVGANDISESNCNVDVLKEGGFFPRGKDKDGCLIFIFKCRLYVKGKQDVGELKRCIVYWFERLEREGKGKPISIFFDMENCGLANMDLDFTKYLIGLFKEYYPNFLSYILIYEMPWILSAAFKVIKSWLPPKAVQRIKFVSKKDIEEYVPLDQALKCWGGNDEYTFTFVPENRTKLTEVSPTPLNNNRKVHFVDGSPMSELGGISNSDMEEGALVSVEPSGLITFVQEDNEYVRTLEILNISSNHISFKVKTTSPEKFRVRPGSGCLTPGSKASIVVSLVPVYKSGNIAKDKFLILSTSIDTPELTSQELSSLWKNIPSKKMNQIHLRCAPLDDVARNGSANSTSGGSEIDANQLNKLTTSVSSLQNCQAEIHTAVQQLRHFQMATIALSVIILGIALWYIISGKFNENNLHSYCERLNPPK